MKRKNLLTIGLIALLFTSCAEVTEIGRVNMISNRNIDSNGEYALLASYSGGTSKELRKSRALNLQDAIDKTVKKIPGGEYLMNAKIYVILKPFSNKIKYYSVEGDVWGHKENKSYRGFKVGDTVTWKSSISGKWKTGVIKSLKDDYSCLIELESGKIIEKKYDNISKAE